MISGTTMVIAHLGYPTAGFKSPMIYNPWFERNGIDAVVVPLSVQAADYPAVLRALFQVENLRGALVTMPHKVATVALLDACSAAVTIAGSCNAVVRRADGTLFGDIFDGEGFVRALRRKAFPFGGANCLVVGAGGVGSAIAASLAVRDVRSLTLNDVEAASAEALAARLRTHYPSLGVGVGPNDPFGYDLVVNATPLGSNAGDPLPFDVARLDASTFVADVVMAEQTTPLLGAAHAIGCPTQAGTDMLFEQIPAYLEFFGFGTATPDELRVAAKLRSP